MRIRQRLAVPTHRRRHAYVIVGAAAAVLAVTVGAGVAFDVASRSSPLPVAHDVVDRGGQAASRGLTRTAPAIMPSRLPSPTASPTPPATHRPTTKAQPAHVAAPTHTLPPVTGCASFKGNQLIACELLPSFGFSVSQMSALIPMWNHESGWNARAENPSSGAYGIPQALPASKMASVAADWRTNPVTQIKWGLGYIKSRYGSPAAAWSFWQAHHWY